MACSAGRLGNLGQMYFDALFKLGAITLSGGLLATIYFYVVCRDASAPRQGPSLVRYFAVAILIGIGGYIAGTAIGIYFACSSPAAANLCGVYGALGVGPLLAGLCLSWQLQSRASAPVDAPAPTTAGGRGWTEHPLVRVIAGLAGAGLALYGAIALLDGEGRGAAAAVVIGIVGVCWGFMGRQPSWFRPR
jgi:hypothetical protein